MPKRPTETSRPASPKDPWAGRKLLFMIPGKDALAMTDEELDELVKQVLPADPPKRASAPEKPSPRRGPRRSQNRPQPQAASPSKLTAARRSAIAKKAAKARWKSQKRP